MGDNLVIVESPAKAGTIQKFLGNGYTVKASIGHIRDLDEKKLSINVDNNFEPLYVIPDGKKKVVSDLKKLADKAEAVWLASDEDREGEAISWHLCEALNLDRSKTKRIVFHEITKSAIENAIKNPRDIDMHLVEAQQARRVLDRLVGFEVSPILWRKIQPKLSAGRVQSVALRLVVDREKEIMSFRKEQYYHVKAVFTPEGTQAQVSATLDRNFSSIEEARAFLQDNLGANFSISSVEKKDGTRTPAAPFTTSTLQQEAARKLHFPVKTTMSVAQALYEKGLITYMRTDSTNLSSLAVNTAKQYIIENFGENYSKPRQYKTKSRGAQEAHEAIRPTYIANATIQGTPQEQKLYNLIWKRTVASQMADAKLVNTSVKVSSDKRSEKFSVIASQIIFDGFLKLYMESTDDEEQDAEEVILPEIKQGSTMLLKSMNADCRYSEAPKRYSEATLVKKLEELGIGRPSTYATIISTLTSGRGYLVKGNKDGEKVEVTNLSLKGGKISESLKSEVIGAEKGKLLPQEIGMIVCDYLVDNFSNIMDYGFTAGVEEEFDTIAEGKMTWTDAISSFYTPFHSRIEEVKNDKTYADNRERELGTDPQSGLKIVAKFGPHGPYVRKGEGSAAQYANLGPSQLIENLTLEDALKLFQLPRTVGSHEGCDVIATKGRFGPYLKYGDKNYSLPKGADPMSVSLEECISIIQEANNRPAANEVLINHTEIDVQVINGRYGPYIKHAGSNYKIPKGTDVAELTVEKCKEIIESSQPTQKGFRRKSSSKK